jgi:hypothetical protein
VIDRAAGTVSSSGPSIRASTWRSASSGNHGSTGSSSRSVQSSTMVRATAAANGLVSESIRKIVSWAIGAVPPTSIVPIASTRVSPWRLTSATRPGSSPRSTWRERTSCSRVSLAVENPLEVIVRSWFLSGLVPACLVELRQLAAQPAIAS